MMMVSPAPTIMKGTHMSNWWAAANNWLIEKANAHFSAWANSPAGAKWRNKQNKSPYYCGYQQPQWMYDMREALAKGDEETVKYLKLVNLDD